VLLAFQILPIVLNEGCRARTFRPRDLTADGVSLVGATKILVVEDSKFLRLSTERALARAGYDVSSAADGEQALQMAREKLPDLILLDMLLPKMSGPDVLKALKADAATAKIAVVVCSGLSQKNAARLEADGAFGFLGKSDLCLDKGFEPFLLAVAGIVKKLPTTGKAQAACAAK
jgi:CheY-like chemotaxis protein